LKIIGEQPFKYREQVLAFCIFLLALGLNLYHINQQSLTRDETFQVDVSRLPFAQMTAALTQDFVHPPLYYCLMHAWLWCFGVGDLQARLLSAAFGTGAVIVMYFLGNYLFGRRTAVCSSLILALSQLSIEYSQQARMYAALRFFVLCSVFTFFVAIRQKRAWAWWSSVVFMTLMIYTHYYSLFLAVVIFVYALCRRRRDGIPAMWLIGGMILPLVCFVPWLFSGVVEQALHSQDALPKSQPFWFQTHWGTIFGAVNRFNNGKLFGVFGPSPRWTYLTGAILFSLPSLLALQPLLRRMSTNSLDLFRRDALALLAGLWLFPLASVIGLGLVFGAQYDVRYVSFCVGPYYLLVGQGISEFKSTHLRRAWVVILLVYSFVSLRSVYFIPYKIDTRGALAYVAREYRTEDCFIPLPDDPFLAREWSIFQEGRPSPRITSLEEVVSRPSDCQNLWVISFSQLDEEAEEAKKEKLQFERTRVKVKEASYFWVDVGLYVLRKLPEGSDSLKF
jgi:4-amino-4-deoxy-L-arabinose transferase-like glycosyltransferase